METVIIVAIASCFFGAAVAYVVMDYRSQGARQKALENVLSGQAEVGKVKKAMLGYTKYLDYLPAGKEAATGKMKSLQVKVIREHTYTGRIEQESLKLDSDASVFATYSAEYLFGFNLKPESFDILGTASGIQIRIGKPSLVGTPYIRSQSCKIQNCGVLIENEAAEKEVLDELPSLVQRYGSVIASEEAIRALCEKKLVELVHSFLAGQQGVSQVPVIQVVYR